MDRRAERRPRGSPPIHLIHPHLYLRTSLGNCVVVIVEAGTLAVAFLVNCILRARVLGKEPGGVMFRRATMSIYPGEGAAQGSPHPPCPTRVPTPVSR